ncbi:MAG: hypothetical protein PHX07_03690 [Candidatus Marinimicrobia bacterium]|jgi:hypothetical protein|nr:hypothetical protein [Candidatus Neomarinimicrobiota bacterium]MDD4961321.1 hypothetical protein [Candidatus Neomarinimicrobiota bacterium]MDD5708941.1 hypothetical protein [Candidatus Neomarinimicrobiota bacterium]MDX9777642.1 choice-of-anchor X domain-containing protein [bacterium]
MKYNLYGIAALFLLLLSWSCGPVYPDPDEEPSYPVPEFQNVRTAYHGERGELHCEAFVLYDLPLGEVNADLELQGFTQNTLSITLNDSAVLGDALAGDRIFSRNIPLTRIDSIPGWIRVQYSVREAGSLVQTFRDTLTLSANQPPLITEIDMPDTLIRPESGSKELLIAVHVDDPNGPQDVIMAYFQVKNNTSGLWGADFDLYDDGSNGDIRAGDGIFSRGLQISAENAATINYFRFRAKDRAASFSVWYPDSVVVR